MTGSGVSFPVAGRAENASTKKAPGRVLPRPDAASEEGAGARPDAGRALATARAGVSRGAGVAGGEPIAAAGQSVTSNAVQAVREKSETAQIISTVDHARAGNGPATVVLALEDALDQRIGHYGIAAGTTARVPGVLP